MGSCMKHRSPKYQHFSLASDPTAASVSNLTSTWLGPHFTSSFTADAAAYAYRYALPVLRWFTCGNSITRLDRDACEEVPLTTSTSKRVYSTREPPL